MYLKTFKNYRTIIIIITSSNSMYLYVCNGTTNILGRYVLNTEYLIIRINQNNLIFQNV